MISTLLFPQTCLIIHGSSGFSNGFAPFSRTEITYWLITSLYVDRLSKFNFKKAKRKVDTHTSIFPCDLLPWYCQVSPSPIDQQNYSMFVQIKIMIPSIAGGYNITLYQSNDKTFTLMVRKKSVSPARMWEHKKKISLTGSFWLELITQELLSECKKWALGAAFAPSLYEQ